MGFFRSKMLHAEMLGIQLVAVLLLWFLMLVDHLVRPTVGAPLTLASFLAVPAAVIGVAQLIVSAHIQRASYIKDYALRFRTDKELTESFHYLVYRYGNSLYEIVAKPESRRTPEEQQKLTDAQTDVPRDLQFFTPFGAAGAPQERRLDNLIGFFDTLGYDLRRKLVRIDDVAGMFGIHLDHFIARRVVDDYMREIERSWPQMDAFHQHYAAPVPFRDFRLLIDHYIAFRRAQGRTS